MNIYCNVSSVNITDGHGRVFEIIKSWFFLKTIDHLYELVSWKTFKRM